MTFGVACRATLLALVTASLAVTACGDDEGAGGEGGTGTGAGGGEGGSSGGGGPGGAGGVPDVTPCGEPAEATRTDCPAECTGGCMNGTCVILCNDDQSCNALIRCPAGLDCQVTCTGENSCRYQIECDDYYRCGITCNATGACTGLEVACGELSECAVSCLSSDACSGGTVMCGDGACATTCLGDAVPNVTCGEACMCADCS